MLAVLATLSFSGASIIFNTMAAEVRHSHSIGHTLKATQKPTDGSAERPGAVAVIEQRRPHD